MKYARAATFIVGVVLAGLFILGFMPSNEQCDALTQDWRNTEIHLSQLQVDDLGDDSAIRATLRAVQQENDFQTEAMTLQLMRNSHCALPKRAPNPNRYSDDILNCIRKDDAGAAECKRENWKGSR